MWESCIRHLPTFTAPATLTLCATAADSDGTVARVDFLNGPTLLGRATTAPYRLAWSNVQEWRFIAARFRESRLPESQQRQKTKHNLKSWL